MDPATSQQALANLQQAQNSMKDPNQALTAREQALGVPAAVTQVGGLRRAITDTTNLLDKVAPSVQGRTQNSLVTNAQANRIIQNEQAPLQQNLQRTSQDYNSAQSDLERLLAQAQQQAQLELSAEDRKIAGLKTIYGALYEREQAERAAQLEREKMAQAERQANAARAAASGGGINLGGLLNQATATKAATAPVAAAKPSPMTGIEQQAYNDVKGRIDSGKGEEALISDYKATLLSASYGNQLDRLKLQFYAALYPSLFKYQMNAGNRPTF